jgi:hypothetical protein
VVLFGGFDLTKSNQPPLNDTWVWNGSTWTPQNPANRPSARGWTQMAYDATDGVFVLFGGSQSQAAFTSPSNYLGDTWTWNGSNWTQQASSPSPVGRSAAMMASDPTGGVVLFGGGNAQGNQLVYLQDTWHWSGGTWAQRAGTSPGPLAFAGMALDQHTNQVVLFGGETAPAPSGALSAATWTWNGSAWTQQHPALTPPPRYSLAASSGPGPYHVIITGGTNYVGTVADTWTWDGADWNPQTPVNGPSARYGASLTYDSLHQQAVLFGGLGAASDADATWLSAVTTVYHLYLPRIVQRSTG